MPKMTKRKQLLDLIRKYIDGTASSKEKEFVEKYYRYFDLKEAPSKSFSEMEKQEIENRMLENIHKGMRQASYKHVVPLYQNVYIRIAAAAILVIIVAGMGIWYSNTRKDMKAVNNSLAIKHDISPGGNKATLTLANGSIIVLNNVQNGHFAQQGNTQVIKLNSGQLVYRAQQEKEPVLPESSDKILYNSLITPRGGQYQVTLPDGSKVWLNASSSLRFPTAFNGKKRKIKVKGEAYFEIKQDASKPFIVQISSSDGSNLGTVKVLGTHFNVNAYLDEDSVTTTLVDGAIKVVRGTDQELLKPGEQAKMSQADNQIEVNKVNTDGIVAWKNGFFQFNRDGIAAIMHEIARWYDVEVIYKDHHIPQGHYTGIISRHTNLSEVLKILETGGFHFKVEGRKIIVN